MRASKTTIFLGVPVIAMVAGMSVAFAQPSQQQSSCAGNNAMRESRFASNQCQDDVALPYRGPAEVGPEDQHIHPYESRRSFW